MDSKKNSLKGKIKLYKYNKILLFILLGLFVMMILLSLLQYFSVGFSNFMWLNVNNGLSSLLYSIMQNFGFLSSYGDIITGIIFGAASIAIFIISFVYTENYKLREVATNVFITLVVLIGLGFNTNIYFNLSNSFHRGINELYMNDNLTTKYTQQDLKGLINYFKNRIITYASSLNRKDGYIVVSEEPTTMAINDLKNLSIKYNFLEGNYPTKVRNLNNHDLVVANFPLGLTSNFTVGIDNENLNDLMKISVITHELCHVKGISRESDADYCLFLSGFNSNSDVSKYAMYLSIIIDLFHALDDETLYNNVMSEFGTLCLDNNYKELCEIYSKDTKKFIKWSDSIEFYTYTLNTYNDNEDKLREYLKEVIKKFNGKLYISDDDKKEVKLDDVDELIDSDSPLYLIVKGETNRKDFNNSKELLEKVKEYFPHLYLSNSKDKESTDEFDYLKPTSTNVIDSLINHDEFDYTRSVRSILEYFDKNIY